MSKFGWSYPAGCDGTPYDDYAACGQCGADLPDADQDGSTLARDGFCSEDCRAGYEIDQVEREQWLKENG